jgi:ribonuclease P protein component
MINFKDLFRFSQKEVSYLFKNATIKCSWRGLKLLQTPPDSLGPIDNANVAGRFGKLLIVTPRSCGKANQRNLFRRRIKDIFYTNKLYLHPVNSVLIAYKNAMTHDFDHLQEFLIKNIPPRVNNVHKTDTPTTHATCTSNKTANNKNSVKPLRLWQRLFIATFDVIRPVFGFIGGACIYPVSCSDYTKHMITTKPIYKSIPLIFLRVLSCNPITALFLRWKNSKRKN